MKIKELTDAYLPIINPLIRKSSGTAYEALFLEPNKSIKSSSIEILYDFRKVYTLGILERSHLTCITYLARAAQWLTATSVAINGNSLLGFAGGLRGHLESAADAFDVLQHLPHSLLHSMKYAFLVFNYPDDLGPSLVSFAKIESSLIHYAYATGKPAPHAPVEHRKKSSKEYNQQLENFGVPRLIELYAKLCELVHPAAPSVNCFLDETTESIIFNPNRDKELIEEINSDYEETIQAMTQHTLNSSLICLSILQRINPDWAALTDDQMMDVGNIVTKLTDFDNFVSSHQPGQVNRVEILQGING
ncbi:hypothetical protein [Comamonas testosteroni]|uniref:hypothetical protein n=1 Tax=Comamonas testosteroni TaxID=285 RepID=UPI000A8E72FE|nr:hypothetical protein [Comamonas testosteroni]